MVIKLLRIKARPGVTRLSTASRFYYILMLLTAFCTIAVPIDARANTKCAPPADAPPFCLTGTVTSGAQSIATVAGVGAPLEFEVRAGDPVGDWRVSEIGERYVTLDRPGQAVRLDLADWLGGDQPVKPVVPKLPAVKKGSMKRLHSWEARGEKEESR